MRGGVGVVGIDQGMRVVAWDRGMERFTGLAAAEALGRPCWQVVNGVAPGGALVCRPSCALFRAARRKGEAPVERFMVQSGGGRRVALVATTAGAIGGAAAIFHLVAPVDGDEPWERQVRLTPRQREVLALLGEGLPTRAIAAQLAIAEHTARNHVRAVLRALAARSRLEAVACARRLGLLP